MSRRPALLVVDVQNDFCPGGALGVPEGDRIIPRINRTIKLFVRRGLPVLATRDWHPRVTRHFKEFGGAWPPHCVQGTKGARFHAKLTLPEGAVILSKGMDPDQDSDSGFQALSLQGRAPESVSWATPSGASTYTPAIPSGPSRRCGRPERPSSKRGASRPRSPGEGDSGGHVKETTTAVVMVMVAGGTAQNQVSSACHTGGKYSSRVPFIAKGPYVGGEGGGHSPRVSVG